MRQLHIAVLVGVLLGVGLLLYDIAQTNSASLGRTTTSWDVVPEDNGATLGGEGAETYGPHAHDDATTEEDRQVFLNERVINGQPTLICIDQQRPAFSRDETLALYEALREAVADWERELGLSLFTIIDRRASTASQSCTGTNAPEFDVLIRFGNCTRARSYACYQDDESKPGEPPRRHFRNPTSTEYSAVVYQGGPKPRPAMLKPHVSTIRHELGHVIGLSDYLDTDLATNTCWGLRVQPVQAVPPMPMGPTQNFVARDVDRYDNHVSVMVSNGRVDECRSTEISYRDKRDFYEAYQPGALDAVHVELTKEEGSNPKSLSVRWTVSEMEDLEHNGTHIAVIGRHPTITAHQGWKVLGVVKLRDNGRAMHALTLPDDPNVDREEFRVVGLTLGTLRTHGNVRWADPLPSSRVTGLSISGTQWLMGDPAYVFGKVWNPDTPQVYIGGSFGSTAACYIAGPGATKTLTLKWFVYSNTTPLAFPTTTNFTITFNGNTYTRPGVSQLSGETDVACSSLQGGASIDRSYPLSVTVSGPAITTPLTASGNVRVQKRNHDRTLRFSTPLTASPSTCVSGQTVTVRWALASNSLPATIRLNGVEATSSPATFTCPSEPAEGGNRVYVSALAEDGSGAIVPVTIQASALTNVRASTSVTATTATATLTWTAPAGASNVSYKLWRSEATSNSSTTGTTYTFENLNPYQTYNLYVWTVDAAGVESAKVVTQVTMPGRPGVPRTAAPGGLQASNITTSSATLNWDAVPGATGYRVWRSSGQSVRLPATARSYTFAGLLPSRKYSLMVWAVGHGGLSPTARVVIHTQGPTLATPTGLQETTSVTATTATATLTWNAVPGAASYGLWRSGGQNVTTTGTSYTFTGLIPHKRYNLYVWAVDSAGHGSAHARVSVTLPGRPGVAQTAAPTGVQASGITASSATLSWNGVAGATGYEVWRSGGQSVDLAATARSYTFTGLTGERRYSLYVWALGSGGMSPQTRVVITTLPAPAPPAGLRATATSTTLTLRWNAAAGATSYEVQRSGSSTVQTVSSGRAYTFTGLTAGASYTLYARSKNNNGHSAWVSVSGVTAPPQPSVPSITATHNSLTLSWSSVRGATSYELKRVGSSTIWTTTSTSYTFPRLSSNASYTLSVRAKNAGGASAWRSYTGTTLLPNPTGVRVSAKTSSSLTLSWTLDSRATWYRVKRGADGREDLRSPSRSSYTFTGLSANTSYTLFVRAVGAGGLTGWSSTSARTATSLAACLTTTRLNTYSTWASLDSHCSSGGSASALWADLKAAGVGVGCISHWNTPAGSWQRYQRGSGWSSFTIAYGAVLWLSSAACPRPSGAGGASGATGASDDGSSSCTDAVKPSTGSTVVRVGGSACVVVSGGGPVQVSNGTHTLNLTLSTGRDWLVLSASEFPDSDAGALLFMELSSGGWLALDPSDGGELTRYAPASAADLPALLDAIVNSASTG